MCVVLMFLYEKFLPLLILDLFYFRVRVLNIKYKILVVLSHIWPVDEDDIDIEDLNFIEKEIVNYFVKQYYITLILLILLDILCVVLFVVIYVIYIGTIVWYLYYLNIIFEWCGVV